jgi:hemerythrin-like domain-containing protein
MLREHVRKEEQLLFEEAQRALSREELDRIGRERRR